MKTNRWMMLAMVTGVMWAGGVQAGDLTPPGPPGSTMHTLEEIYQRQATLEANQVAMEARLAAAGMAAVPSGMVLVPGGSFVMGSSTNVLPTGEGGSDEQPQHYVTLSTFYMDATEVTKAKWDEVYAWAATNGYTFENAGSGKATDHPVYTVDWYDCVKWANARSEMEGLPACYTVSGEVYRADIAIPVCDFAADGYRLPTEAEWEKAARGGVANRRFPWSATSRISHSRANYRALAGYSYDNSGGAGYHPDYDSGGYPYTSPVGSFAPNGHGLYDMAGNVHEWCWDWFDPTYYTTTTRGSNPRGPETGTSRVRRGGSWFSSSANCRASMRYSGPPGDQANYLGFRLVRAGQ